MEAAHWVATKPGVPALNGNDVIAMAVDPQSPSTVYAAIAPPGGRYGGLWESVDGAMPQSSRVIVTARASRSHRAASDCRAG
jgi:hypothetical protein